MEEKGGGVVVNFLRLRTRCAREPRSFSFQVLVNDLGAGNNGDVDVKGFVQQDHLGSLLVRSLGLRLRLASGLEELLVVLLGLDEGILEEVGIWRRLGPA